MIMKHTNTTSSDLLHQRLSAIPISAWEDDMPILDAVIRETIRLVVNGAALRRNVHEDSQLAGKTISKGSFVTYPVYDAHLNPRIYTNPSKFDPDRFSPGREEDKKEKYAYLGWGAGTTFLLSLMDHANPVIRFRSSPMHWNEGSEAGNQDHCCSLRRRIRI